MRRQPTRLSRRLSTPASQRLAALACKARHNSNQLGCRSTPIPPRNTNRTCRSCTRSSRVPYWNTRRRPAAPRSGKMQECPPTSWFGRPESQRRRMSCRTRRWSRRYPRNSKSQRQISRVATTLLRTPGTRTDWPRVHTGAPEKPDDVAVWHATRQLSLLASRDRRSEKALPGWLKCARRDLTTVPTPSARRQRTKCAFCGHKSVTVNVERSVSREQNTSNAAALPRMGSYLGVSCVTAPTLLPLPALTQ
jgi:hypothetical protein